MTLSRPVLSRTQLLLAAVVPPLVVGVVGLFHPPSLTEGAADRWTTLHIVLLPLFPLMALGPWLVARSIDKSFGRLALLLGFVFACFYSALDVLAGIGAGSLRVDHRDALGTVFGMATDLGQVGSIAFIGALAVASGCVLRVAGLRGVPGAVIALGGAFLFMQEHVYPPWGVLSMALVAAGSALLVLAVRPAADA